MATAHPDPHAVPGAPDPRSAWESWQHDRLASLRAPRSWLTLVGLHILDLPSAGGEKSWTIGSAATCDIPLPASAPPVLGELRIASGIATFQPRAPEVRIDGTPTTTAATLHDDRDGSPSLIACGSISIAYLHRNGAPALRVRDENAETRTTFEGLDLFPFDPALVLHGRVERPSAPTTLAITNVTGYVESQPLAATILVDIKGTAYRLVTTSGGDDGSLFLVFADATNGAGTYGGGRFLDIAAPDAAGDVTLDFNRAYNPACAFTRFATCPMPPAANRVACPIEAGERYPPRWKPTT